MDNREWIALQEQKGITLQQFNDVDLCEESQGTRCYALIYSETLYSNNSKRWQNNVNYFAQILKTVKGTGNRETNFFLLETEDNHKPAILYYKDGEEISVDLLGDLQKKYLDQGPKAGEKIGLDTILAELSSQLPKQKITHSPGNAENLAEWIECLETKGAFNLGEYDSNMEMGTSFALVFHDQGVAQGVQEKLRHLQRFNKFVEDAQEGCSYYIMEQSLHTLEKSNVTIHRYESDECLSRDVLLDEQEIDDEDDQISSDETLPDEEESNQKRDRDLFKNQQYLSGKNSREIGKERMREDYSLDDFEVLSQGSQGSYNLRNAIPNQSRSQSIQNEKTELFKGNATNLENKGALCLKSWLDRFKNEGAETIQLLEHTRKDGIILIISKEGKEESLERQHENLFFFEKCITQNRKIDSNNSGNCWVVEPKEIYSTEQSKLSFKVQQYDDNKCISKNLLFDEINSAKTENTISCGSYETDKGELAERKTLHVPCPCNSNDPISIWKCSICHQKVLAADEYVYCNCGRSLKTNCWFKCSDKEHGCMFLKSTRSKSLNILLLGETGVGKSTLINAFFNYVIFGTLREALFSQSKLSTPTSLPRHDTHDHRINLESLDYDEGETSTKTCERYRFNYGEYEVNLIDTPGIGGSRGNDQDNKNFALIKSYISTLDSIDGICILLKPTQSRLPTVVNYCVGELLSQLHKNASSNIIFLFTHARETFYRPGESYLELESFLKRIKTNPPHVDIPLETSITYYFESEAFRFLEYKKNNASNQPVEFSDEEDQMFSVIWDKSVSEFNRLIRHVISLTPHTVKYTLSESGARKMIIDLSKPLCDIIHNISLNIIVLEGHREEIKKAGDNIDKLSELFDIPFTLLEVLEESKPRTICTSKNCVAIDKSRNHARIGYKRVCHEPCRLPGEEPGIINNLEVQDCAGFEKGKCQVCGCLWETHLHRKFDLQVLDCLKCDEAIEYKLNTVEQRSKAKKETLTEIEKDIRKYKLERKIIIQACAKFAVYLNPTSIPQLQDTITTYLEYIIQSEDYLKEINQNSENLSEELKNVREEYFEQKAHVSDHGKAESLSNTFKKEIDPQDITETITQLKALEIYGASVSHIVEAILKSEKPPPAEGPLNTPVKYVIRTLDSK